jgi:hypothetical protein
MPLNWLMEAVKWKVLHLDFEAKSLKAAIRDVLNGLMMTWFIPFTLGDVVGRLQYSSSRLKASKAIIWNRMASMIVASIFGTIGMLTFFFEGSLPAYYIFSFGVLLLIVGILLIVKRKMALTIFSMSVIRYVVMALQLYFCLMIFVEFESSMWVMAGVTWIFFYRSILPALWGSLGVREMSAIVFFECCHPTASIVAATLLVWLINLVVPSVLYALSNTYRLATSQSIIT